MLGAAVRRTAAPSSRSASRSAATRCCASPRKRARARRAACAPIAAVSAPLDLAAGARAIGRGFGRQVYTRMFMRTMKKKAFVKLAPASRALRRRGDDARRATCAISTTSSPGRCTASPAPTTTTRAARPARSLRASAFRRWCSMRATIRSCPRRRLPRRGRGRSPRDALAAGARRPRRLRARVAGRATCRACRAAWATGWPRISDARAAQNRRHGRDRRRGAEEVAERAALLRLARARRARRLVHARRPHPGTPGRSRASRAAASSTRSCASSSAATTPPTSRAPGSSRTGRSASTSSSRRRPGSGACRPTRSSSDVVVTSHTGLAARAGERLPRRVGPALSRQRPRPGHRAHARHGRGRRCGRARRWQPQDVAFAALVARFGYRLEPGRSRARRRSAKPAAAGRRYAAYFDALTM